MFAHRVPLFVFLAIAAVTPAAFCASPELKVAQVLENSLTPGQVQVFTVSLGEADFAQIKVNPRGSVLIVKTYDPSGKPFRGARLGPQEDQLNLVAERAGNYRIEVGAVDKRATVPYSIVLEKLVTLAARVQPPKPVVESRRIQARASIERGETKSVDAFWDEVKKSGAPLIEPIAGDPDNMAVTFLWQGQPDTHNVIVLWLPYAGVVPDEYFMTRLRGSDVWYKTIKVDRSMRLAYTLAPNGARLHPLSLALDGDAITMTAAAARPDPLNPKVYRIDPDSVDAPEFRGNSVLEMPDAPPQPWIAMRPNVPAGKLEKHLYKSARLNNEREVAVYLPPQYSPRADPYPLLVLFDEDAYLNLVPTPTILDNLISERRIPPVVALLVGNAEDGARERELLCNPEFTAVLAGEVMPWAHGLYNFTRDPRLTVIGGSSLGGLGAACAALWHPETFGNVLAQSGAFHRQPPSPHDAGESAEPNWFVRQVISTPKEPVRFYLDAGTAEFNATGSGESILFCSRTLRDVLRAKGYEVEYQEFAGGHDYLSWRGTLADGLTALLGNAGSKTRQEQSAAK